MNKDQQEYELRLLITRVAQDNHAPDGLLFWLRHMKHVSIATMWRGQGYNDTERNLSHTPGIPRPDWMLYLLRLCKSPKADEIAPHVKSALEAEAHSHRCWARNLWPLQNAIDLILERVPASALSVV